MRGRFCALAVTFLIAANGGRAGSTCVMDAHFDPKRMPVEAVELSGGASGCGADAESGLLGWIFDLPALSSRSLSSAVWWWMTGMICMERSFFKSYLKMIHVEQGWEEFLRTHQSSCVLLPRDAALANMLAKARAGKRFMRMMWPIAFVRDPVNPMRTVVVSIACLRGCSWLAGCSGSSSPSSIFCHHLRREIP